MDAAVILDWVLKCTGTAIAGVLAVMVFRVMAIPTPRRLASNAAGSEYDDAVSKSLRTRHAQIAERLASLIRLKTISYDPGDTPPHYHSGSSCGSVHHHLPAAGTHAEVAASHAELRRSHEFLRGAYPLMHSRLQVHVVNELSLLYIWPGSDPSLSAVCCYAHLDVVPVPDAAQWVCDPFGGEIRDGFLFGRGAIDDKQSVIGICEAVEALLNEGSFTPRRTIAIVFGHDEEIGGDFGARLCYERIHKLLRGRVDPARKVIGLLLDEGLFVLEGAVPGLYPGIRTALICTEEKGFVSVKLTAHAEAGHASTPHPTSAIGIISRALHKLEASPFPASLRTAAVRSMFEALLPYMAWPHRFLFANLWVTAPLVLQIMARTPASAALIRTTTALTVVKAGDKNNTLPHIAHAVVNHRILPGETVQSVLTRDARVIGDTRVSLSAMDPVPPCPPATRPLDPAFRIVARAVEGLCGNTVAVPALMVGATDSRWAWDHADVILRHCPTELKAGETKMFHGRDERISVENLAKISMFYARVLRDADAAEL